MLPRITDAITQFIKPIGSTAGQTSVKPKFERFNSSQQREQPQESGKESEKDPEKEKAPLADNVIPLRRKISNQEKALVGLLISLKDSHKLLLSIGRMLYARMKKEQDKSKLRKGVILDTKA